MVVPKMVKTGFKSDFWARVDFRGMGCEWKLGTAW
jgi:hypothetical protein